jgi:hypothetical protein
MLANQKDGLMV